MDFRFVYITCEDREEALRVGRKLVEERLAACANIINSMTSLYWWQGEIVEDEESILVVKSRASHEQQLIEAVKSCHSYEIPCIVSLPILSGNPDYLTWLETETNPQQ